MGKLIGFHSRYQHSRYQHWIQSFQSRKSSEKVSFYDTGGSTEEKNQETGDGFSMDDIWKEIEYSAVNIVKPVKDIYSEQSYCLSYPDLASPSWENSLDSIWKMDEDKSKMSFFALISFHSVSNTVDHHGCQVN
ncbi:hypothetical protein Bca101_043178 [Brassica carinata]